VVHEEPAAPPFRIHASRITHHASRITHHALRITHYASRITHHALRITHYASRITHHALRITHHASRLMGLIDFILNIAALLLWLGWRASRQDLVAVATPSTLAGTLRRADSPKLRRWQFPLILAGLLLARAVFYSQIGPAVDWSAGLDLSVISVSFRSDVFSRMLLFSILGFGSMLAAFWLSVLFVSLLNRPDAEFDSLRRFVRLHIGFVDNWPGWMKLILPWLAISTIWWLLSWLLVYQGLLPRPVSGVHRLQQGFAIGLGSYLVWKYVIVGVLVLHIINSYVYLGSHPFWAQVSAVARRILRPLGFVPLTLGRVDFAPLVGIATVFFLARLAESSLTKLYAHLPL
jgi:uncharacterized protein YggT (Ycf19 family)